MGMSPSESPQSSGNDRTAWWTRYQHILDISLKLGRLPRLSDGVGAIDTGWIASQRRATTITAEQRAALRALPGWSDHPRLDVWEARAEELRQFIATHHRMPRVRGSLPGESALAHWHSRQRVAADRGRLSMERARALDYATRLHRPPHS